MENVNIKQKVVMEVLRDESFKKELLKNPTAALQKKFKEWSLEWPKDCKAFVHMESSKELIFVIPEFTTSGRNALNEEQLAEIAAGVIVKSVCINCSFNPG